MYVMIWIVLVVCSFMSCTVMADLLPTPIICDFPLHRIGMEIVLETVAATTGGGVLLRWIVKKGWKREKTLTRAERKQLRARLEVVLPEIKRDFTEWTNSCGILDSDADQIPEWGESIRVKVLERFLRDRSRRRCYL